jgi:phage terminase large subunit-like protein
VSKATPAVIRPLTELDAVELFCKVPTKGAHGGLSPMVLYPEQRSLIAAAAARDGNGAPLYDELAALWIKKAGKSETAGGLIIAELIGNTTEADREIIVVASSLDQSKQYAFESARRFSRRDPILEKRIKPYDTTLVYKEIVVDQRTGGRHTEEHIVRAIPARDVKSLHGNRATLTVYDEFHAHSNYDLMEALAPAPTRKHPRILYLSYAGLKVHAREGNPLWDLWQRWQARTDPRLFVSYIGGPDGWKQVPWITPAFIAQQRRQFAAVPAKFQRLWQNEWVTDDVGSFLSAQEIREAIDPALTEASGPVIGAAIGVDIGLTRDTTAVVASHVHPVTYQLTVDAVRILRGTKAKPVSLSTLEDVIVDLARVLGTRKVTCDQWQASMLAERLRARGLSVHLVTCDVARLDRMATHLKTWFARRTIRIPNHPGLIEQLETLVGEEMRRRDKVRFTAYGEAHDDAAIALCLSAEPHSAGIGQRRMAEMDGCALEGYMGRTVGCYLLTDHARVPSDPVCRRECPGHISTLAAYEEHSRRTGETPGLRMFVAAGLIRRNNFAVRRSLRDTMQRIGLI